MLLILDHYDSFTHNLARYFSVLDCPSKVVQHDFAELADLNPDTFTGLVLSPGPGRPEQAKTALQLVERWSGKLPILGICLGHQIIATAFGARVSAAPRPMHGYLSEIEHDGDGLFSDLQPRFQVTRYHSLLVEAQTLPGDLQVSATTVADHLVMGLRHRTLPVEGVQFHPEAHLTENGLAMLANFVEQTRLFQVGNPVAGVRKCR